ncbi:MAG: UvrD-helicase domain-containing protein, partial [Rhodospirillales bacterium]|nr:UvrD-helicase domain-containing protein [Rhodospirillales bacterium]
MNDPFDLTDLEDSAPPALHPAGRTVYLDGLNESQLEAVETTDGPVLVLAGAGTGKTRVLTTRLSHILMQGKARPGEILAVTFTNKAAREMQDRVGRMLGTPVEGWWVGTFHALGARILRRHAEAVGLRPNFTILDADDQVRLLKQILDARDIDPKRFPPRTFSAVIQRWKDRALMPDKVSSAEAIDQLDGKAIEVYVEYQAQLQRLNAADFGDLLLLCVKLFQDFPDVLKSFQARFRYILVDEYQDTNVAQYLWLRLLAQAHKNICCVGDDDQSIYSWRGAEVGNILRFEQDFPGAKVVRLERNYRSTPHILGAASGLIAKNEGRLGKTLWTDLGDGEKVRVHGVWDSIEEARWVGEEIEARQTRGEGLNSMAILVRTSAQTREFEERLITLGIPYQVIGGLRFYERREIRDAVAYLRIIAQPDDDLAFGRIVNFPKRGLGDKTLQTVHLHARARGISLTKAVAELSVTDELGAKARKTLADLMVDFSRWRGDAGRLPPSQLMDQVLSEAGIIEYWKLDKSIEAPGRVDNLKELVVGLSEFDTLTSFLEHVSLVMDNEDLATTDKVTVMTLHGAKGLEFDTVFLPGWEEGLFPHQRALDETGVQGLEEERRLAYVGLTRARRTALISFAANRRIFGQWQSSLPSRFVEELPRDHIERAGDVGVSSGAPGFDDGPSDAFKRKTNVGYGAGHGGGHGGGWNRAQQRRPVDEIVYAPARVSSGGLSVGQRVFHQKFGYGAIKGLDGDKLDIQFEKAGYKKVMASFVEPA